MTIIQSISGATNKPFSVIMVRWWWRKWPAIEICGKVYCVVPSRDAELAEGLCRLLNDGLQGAGQRAAAGKE